MQSAEAHAELTNPSDRLPLRALEEAHTEGRLRTWPLIIVRHAKAKPRSSWTRAEGDRPLAATGLRQAQAVSRLLSAWQPDRVVSSPWVRCVQTVRPYVKSRPVKFKTVDAITERSAKRKPGKARSAVEAQFDKGRPAVLCTHRPVLPVVFEVLARHMPAGLAIGLPSKDPYLAPGEAVICQVSAADEGESCRWNGSGPSTTRRLGDWATGRLGQARRSLASSAPAGRTGVPGAGCRVSNLPGRTCPPSAGYAHPLPQ